MTQERRLTASGTRVLVLITGVMWPGSLLLWIGAALSTWDPKTPLWETGLYLLASGVFLAAPLLLARRLLHRPWMGKAWKIAMLVPAAAALLGSVPLP